MPTLEWIGKSKVINHHQDVPFRVLERKYSFDENGQHNEDNGSENMIIRGDNLEALKALLPRYEGRIKCIYIDPPYNTGNEGWVYNDNVNDPYTSLLTLDRSCAGSRADIVHTRSCKVRSQNGALKLRILLDKNSVEVFVNDGEQTMTAWIYTPQSADGITFAADGQATITVEQFELNL